MFKGIFDVAKAPSDGGALDHLRKVVEKHFSNEEVSISDPLHLMLINGAWQEEREFGPLLYFHL